MRQLDDAAAPLEVKYVPMGHPVQTLEPEAVAYIPAPQLVQATAPAAEYWPATQLKQADVPELTSYVPAAQLEHELALFAE